MGKQITREQLVQMFLSGKKFKLVDVLDKEHYDAEHILGAISIPLIELRDSAPSLLQKSETIIVYCASFSCMASTKAVKILESLGYQDVSDYKGGLQDYKEANLPLAGSLYFENIPDAITVQHKPISLVGRKLRAGVVAPNFKVVDDLLAETTLDNFENKIKVITTFPSLDTPTCERQLQWFNAKASQLAPNIVILAISKDLPFAQKRFCKSNDIESIKVLSDYKYSSVGINYGLLIRELNLLARSIIILDQNNVVRYFQLVSELSEEPNYQEAITKLEEIVSLELEPTKLAVVRHCVPCESGTPPLANDKIENLFITLAEWQIVDNKKIVKEFKFKDFMAAKYFLDVLAVIAEEQGHHPSFTWIYNKLKVTLTTHVAGGLTNNDFVMAQIIDQLQL